MPHESSLHYLDLDEQEEVSITLVMTVWNNFEGSNRQIQGAIKARRLQGMLGNPLRWNFEGMVHANLIVNYPVTLENISPAYELFGSNLTELQGKTVQWKPEHVVMDYAQIPRGFI